MTFLGLIPCAFLMMFGQELMTWFLGKRWEMAGKYVEILAPLLLSSFITTPYQAATAAMRKQKLWFWLQMMVVVARLSIIPAAAMAGATAEFTLTVFVWASVASRMLASAIAHMSVPRRHPGWEAKI
jgi:O-antigen/teichoic acid export membrane protein